METIPESTSQGIPFKENRGPFPCFGNIVSSYMAMSSIPRFTIFFPVWLFLTGMLPNIQTAPQPNSPPPKQYQP